MTVGTKQRFKKCEQECHSLNDKCIQSCHFTANVCNERVLIDKVFFSPIPYNWEITVYMKLLESNFNSIILVDTEPNQFRITYHVNNYMSLRHFLARCDEQKLMLLLNELFSFVQSFKASQFVHGNLHIDNIYVDIEGDTQNFYIIDFSQSFFTQMKAPFNQVSCLGEPETFTHYKSTFIWDIFTLYISLKSWLKRQKQNNSTLLDQLVETYIKPTHFLTLMNFVNELNYSNLSE